jgi:hypothetical protein
MTSSAAPVRQHRMGRAMLGLVSGLLFGLGLALMLVLYSVIALGTKAPWVVVAVSVGLATAVGLLPRRVRAAR